MEKEFEFQVGDVVEFVHYNGEFVLEEDDSSVGFPLCIETETERIYSFTIHGKISNYHDKPAIKLIRRPKNMKKVKLWMFSNHEGFSMRAFYTEDKSQFWSHGKLNDVEITTELSKKWIKTNCFIEVEVEE